LKPPSDQDWIAKYCGALIVCLVGIVASGYFAVHATRIAIGYRSKSGANLFTPLRCCCAPFAIIIAISVFWARRSILCPTL
jgi:hypothetical protein